MPRKRQAREYRHEAVRRKEFFLRQSKLTQAGPLVRGFVTKLKPGSVLGMVEELGYKIARIPIYRLPRNKLSKVYARRTAEQVLRDNAAYAKLERSVAPQIGGCVDYAHVAVACLRAMGIPARFVRWSMHSVAAFSHGGEEYFLDPFKSRVYGDKPLHEVTGQEKEMLGIGKRRGLYFEGLDAHDIGLDIRSFREPRNKKRKVEG